MKITFTCEYTPEIQELGERTRYQNEHVYPKVSMEFEAETLESIYTQFRDFLRGCGFHIEFEIGELEPCEPSPGTKAVDELREEYHQEGSEK